MLRVGVLLNLCCITVVLGCGGESTSVSSTSTEEKSASKDSAQGSPSPTKVQKALGQPESKPPVAEQSQAELTETPYFSLRLPPGWHIEEELEDEGDNLGALFNVTDPNNSQVFAVNVATDEPRFIQCFCSPWENYLQYERHGIKYADLSMDVGSQTVRTLKAVGVQYGTDVHLMYEHHDRKLLDETIESIRPF